MSGHYSLLTGRYVDVVTGHAYRYIIMIHIVWDVTTN